MFEQLKTKLLSWTPELANNFHENVTRQGHYAWRIWETTSTGYYFYDATCAEYRDYNGDTWMLLCGDHTESFQVQIALSDHHEANNYIRIQKPTIIETHKIHNLTFTLVKLESPYGTRGIPMDQLYKVENGLPIMIDLAKQYLLAGNIQTQTLDSLTEFSNNRYPIEFQNDNFRYDPVTGNFFMFGLRYTESREHFISYLDTVINLANYGASVLGYDHDFKTELENFRNLECTTLRPL
jgi:hypothetical protein